MCEFKQKLVGRCAKIIGVFLTEIIFMFFWSQYYAGSMDHRFLEQSYIVVMFCSYILYLLFLHLYDAMNLSAYRWNEIVLGQVLSQILTNVIMYCVSCFLTLKILNILPVIAASTVQLAVSAAWICIFQKLYIRSSILERMIIVYGEKADVGALIKEYGGFAALLYWIKKVFKGRKGGLLGMGLLVGLMDIATANNTVAIVMANPIAKEMSGNYGISNKKAASILDTFSCIFQGILPYGAQMLVAISAASGLGETVSAFDILPRLFYPYMLFISSLVFISFEKNA